MIIIINNWRWFYFLNRKLEVQLPRFLLEKSYALRDVLQTLNMNKMFQEDADIIDMGSKGPKLTQVTVRPSVFLSLNPPEFLPLCLSLGLSEICCVRQWQRGWGRHSRWSQHVFVPSTSTDHQQTLHLHHLPPDKWECAVHGASQQPNCIVAHVGCDRLLLTWCSKVVFKGWRPLLEMTTKDACHDVAVMSQSTIIIFPQIKSHLQDMLYWKYCCRLSYELLKKAVVIDFSGLKICIHII